MGKLVEYTLVTVDGVFDDPSKWGLSRFRDEAYMNDGLAQLLACEAILMGRSTYEAFSSIWPARTDPWANRMNAMRKYVFSSTLTKADWNNSVLDSGDTVEYVKSLKQDTEGALIVYGHGRLAESLMMNGLTDLLDISVNPLLLGHGKTFRANREGIELQLCAVKSFSRGIVKITYELKYGPAERAS